MAKRTKSSTRDHLLDVAERHFGAYGFAGTSLRGIIRDAKANVAAVAYYFGTKEELFSAVVARFAEPVVTEQLRLLELVVSAGDVQLKNILLAFYTPPVSTVVKRAEGAESLSVFLGRMQTEPEPVFSLVDKNFAQCRSRFIEAFRTIKPTASEADLHWYFEYMLSLIVCFLTRGTSIRSRYGAESMESIEEAISRMVDFCLAGMS